MTGFEMPATRRYLVELYLPRRSEAEIARELARLQKAVARLASQGIDLTHLRSLFIPADETCFHLLAASEPEAVEQALHEAGIEHERLRLALDLKAHDPDQVMLPDANQEPSRPPRN